MLCFNILNLSEFTRSEFKLLALVRSDGLEGELPLIPFEEGAQFKLLLGLENPFDHYVVLNYLQELRLHLGNLLSSEERLDEGEICIGELAIVPDLLSH